MARGVLPVRLAAEPIERHYHPRPYATLVLDGSYEEAGDQGRLMVAAGDILFHPAFSAHRDMLGRAGARVLDLPLPLDVAALPGLARMAEPDRLLRIAANDLPAAQELLLETFAAIEQFPDDPSDSLAVALSADPSLSIGGWAARQGFSREWLSRRFRRLYGIDAARYRGEARARLAWRKIFHSSEPLAEVALDCGFADQAHMTRAVTRLTDVGPRAWRRGAVTSVQESPRSAA